jgi:uncharacterized protein (DUF433 family)
VSGPNAVVKRTEVVRYNSDAMIQLTLTQTTPLIQEADGTVRITGSRVTLDTIIGAFQKGATAEQIQDSFPSLSLAQIYGAIAYYLNHEADVETYLCERRAEAESIKHEIESQQDTAGFRASVRRRAYDARAQQIN